MIMKYSSRLQIDFHSESSSRNHLLSWGCQTDSQFNLQVLYMCRYEGLTSPHYVSHAESTPQHAQQRRNDDKYNK